MVEVAPIYQDKFTPLNFPGFFVEEGEEGEGLSNESESLGIDIILHTTGPSDTPDRADRVRTTSSSGSSGGRAGSRPMSKRDSEEVVVGPLELDAPAISVKEVSHC